MKIMQSNWRKLLFGVYLLPIITLSFHLDTFGEIRWNILNEEHNKRLGSQLTLSHEESIVNTHLMKLKVQEMKLYYTGLEMFPSSMLFTDAKKQIDQSKVFQFLQKMPKDCVWELVAEARKNYAKGVQAFDNMLINTIILNSDKLKPIYSNQTAIWNSFEHYFSIVSNLIRFKPVYQVYIYKGLIELFQDNIQHFEIRHSLSPTYQLDGSHSSVDNVFEQIINAVNLFKKRYCKNCTVRIIIACHRNSPNSVILETLKETIVLRHKYPQLVVGFDMVGQEDNGKTLWSLINILQNQNVPFYFHAGETNSQGTPVDENLLEALLLRGTKRVGHGYAILKHTRLLQLAKERNIPFEVCPISNQLLGFVYDLRNHPATYLIANNFTVVISSDDPSVWKASGLSHDLYSTFMGMVSMGADLRLLKQLAINSIKFSSLSAANQAMVLADWEQRWNNFIMDTVCQLALNK